MVNSLGECFFKEGKLDKAIKYLVQSQPLYDNTNGWRAAYYPKSVYLLGRIYEKKGDRTKAIENYEKLLLLWKDADKDLSDLIDAKARLAKLRGVAKR